ncbi:MAG TPA: hypothetical protein VFF33_14100 [Ignavibacteriaceae bacterium]|nr:hypothetical protein [Ignavibacteriaceae bacterium]
MNKYFTDDLTLKITSVAVILFAVFDLLGILDNIPWFAERIPKIILLLLGMIVLLLSSSMQNISNIVSRLGGEKIEIIEIDNAAEMYYFISKQLLKAKCSIEDITWGSYTGYRTAEEQDAYEYYVNTMRKVCKRENIMYKEISSLSDKHYFERAKNLFDNYNYHLAYHNIDNVNVPLISYTIVDSNQVICGFSRIPGQIRPLDGIKYMSIRTPLLVKFFKDYYDTIWDKAEKIKESLHVDLDKMNQIKQKVS